MSGPAPAQLFEEWCEAFDLEEPWCERIVEYAEDRIGAAAIRAFEYRLVAARPPDACWRGRRLRGPWDFAFPLYKIDGQNLLVTLADQQPVDIVMRATKPTGQGKMRHLGGAASGVTKTFGLVGMALADSDGGELVIVEGALNWLVHQLARWPSREVLGLNGSGTAAKVCQELATEIKLLRLEGVSGPTSILIDTDADGPGDKAAQTINDLAEELGIPARRVVRQEIRS